MLEPAILREIDRLRREGGPFCVTTIVDGRGSIPQIVGATAIFTREGLVYGTVGGGRLEAVCGERARGLLTASDAATNHFERVNLQRDLGMTCGGEVALYFEVCRRESEWNIVLFGAGHVAQVLCRFLIELDCQVVCVDTRPEWLGRLPASERLEAIRVDDYREGIHRIVPGANVLIMTMGHASDLPILRTIAEQHLKVAEIGVLGSEAKSRIIRKQLIVEGADRSFVDALVCPLGEKLGNNTPAEIAVGVVSQLLSRRRASHA
jgi:xanthine dehydrogenase accessory factor